MARATVSMDEQLEDLTRRFQLLEGERKATHESATLNKTQNKEIIKQMQEENKTLRTKIQALRNEKPKSINDQLEGKMGNVQGLQRKLDLLTYDNGKKRKTLEELEWKLNELTMDSKLPKTDDSPQMRHIRVLENRLDKAMIKCNEAQSIRKTYEAIVKRLNDERIGFDQQLAAVERTLKAKERDYEELLLLSHDAYHAKELSQAELHRFEQGVMEERNQRDKEVQEKKLLVQQRVEMNHRLEQREKVLKKQHDIELQGERQMKETMDMDEATTGAKDHAAKERQTLQDYEDALNRITQATGVSDVNEVIQKFLTVQDTRKNLFDIKTEHLALIDKLTDERKKLRLQVDDLKFSSGGTVGRRRQRDDFEKAVAEATEKFDRSRAKYERMAKMLIDMKSGIGHLSEKLAYVKLGGEQRIEMSDHNVEDVLQQCGLKISKLMGKTSQMDDALLFDDGNYEEKLLARSQADVRIKLNEHDQDGDDDDDDFNDDVDEDVWNRRNVKYNSEQIRDKQQAKNRRTANPKKGAL